MLHRLADTLVTSSYIVVSLWYIPVITLRDIDKLGPLKFFYFFFVNFLNWWCWWSLSLSCSDTISEAPYDGFKRDRVRVRVMVRLGLGLGCWVIYTFCLYIKKSI